MPKHMGQSLSTDTVGGINTIRHEKMQQIKVYKGHHGNRIKTSVTETSGG